MPAVLAILACAAPETAMAQEGRLRVPQSVDLPALNNSQMAQLATPSASAGVEAGPMVAALPPLANPSDPSVAARDLFARKLDPAHLRSSAIGGYSDGCLAGAVALPINGPNWQVMRLSRNRNWGHPSLIRFLERYAAKASLAANWPGLLIGDLSQPRGGPALSGHKSHQIGLDVDVWLTPMPKHHELSNEERELFWATNFVSADGLDVNRRLWTAGQAAIIRQAALDPEVERIFVNAAIKKELCRIAGSDRSWLHKVRPWYFHQDHLHIRLRCPPDSPQCKPQRPAPAEEGCGSELDFWFTNAVLHTRPSPPGMPLTMAQLPAACRAVLNAR